MSTGAAYIVRVECTKGVYVQHVMHAHCARCATVELLRAHIALGIVPALRALGASGVMARPLDDAQHALAAPTLATLH